jgi:hypothetical protein
MRQAAGFLASRSRAFQPPPDSNSVPRETLSTGGSIALMTDLVARARAFAIRKHRRIDHRRKYSKQPYDVHLEAVADLVAGVTGDPEMVAAAWLHDIVEDTPITLDDVEREFGGAVARLVDELTDVSRPGDGNRAARKAIDRSHLAAASPRAKTIKLADLCDNARDICRYDGVLSRADLEKPIGRMWLFGIVTLVEFDFIRRIRARWPDQSWAALLSPGRLDKARQLQEERARRGQPADLLDCLQLADKGSILIHDPAVLRDWGYSSKQSAKAALQDIQSLRNHLAHSQDIVAHHWHQIAGLSRRLDDWMLENAGPIVDLPR